MSGLQKSELAPQGSTGNNSHAAVGVAPNANNLAAEFIVEAAGGTPTVTFGLQGTFADNPSATDWFPLLTFAPESDAGGVTHVRTAVSRFAVYFGPPHRARFVKKVRIVTTANTNITYSANLFALVDN